MWRENLLKYMQEFGVSKHILAERSGIPYDTVKRICSGKTSNPLIDTLDRLTLALGITLQDILADTTTVIGGKDLAELQSQYEALKAERDLLTAQKAILETNVTTLTTENELLKTQLLHKDELLAVHNRYLSLINKE